jgi:tetratricopeptide (TPR) repeat protein
MRIYSAVRKNRQEGDFYDQARPDSKIIRGDGGACRDRNSLRDRSGSRNFVSFAAFKWLQVPAGGRDLHWASGLFMKSIPVQSRIAIRPYAITTLILAAGCIFLAAHAAAGESAAERSARAQKIYQTLARASGDSRTPPRLDIRADPGTAGAEDGRRVAWYDPRGGSIGIDDKVLRLCGSLDGDHAQSCMALFLGHELAHFYKDHKWGADFGSRFDGLQVARRIRLNQAAEEQLLAFEAQADVAGGIYCHLAGFDTLGIAERALASIYQAYGLDAELRGYPSLAERQQIARKSADNLAKQLPLFDAGNLLFLLGNFEEAGRVFDYVAESFPSREILNNAGVSRSLAAAVLFPGEVKATAYPWSLDGETRLRVGAREVLRQGAAESLATKRSRLLAEARDRFQDALRRDPAYGPAMINLACVEELAGHRGTAVDLAESALELAERTNRPALARLARLARSIARLHGNSAQEALAEIAALGPPTDPLLAPWLGNDAGQKSASLTRGGVAGEESISGLKARDLQIPAAAGTITIAAPSPLQSKIVIGSKWTASYSGLRIQIGSLRIAAITTGAGYPGKSVRGIAVGAPWTETVAAYGQPERRQPFGSGMSAIYERLQLIVRTGEDDRIVSWTVYDIQER